MPAYFSGIINQGRVNAPKRTPEIVDLPATRWSKSFAGKSSGGERYVTEQNAE
jgi:hypothetical protein